MGVIVNKFPALALSTGFIMSTLFLFSCIGADSEVIDEKVSSQLHTQVNLRKAQIAVPTPDRLEMMKNVGMRLDNLELQRIFIHLSQELNSSQIEEIETLGIILYPDSWLPPVGNHPTGAILADMPIDRLAELTEKDYVVRLETAERLLVPQNGAKPQ
jgi:hypothetical protein